MRIRLWPARLANRPHLLRRTVRLRLTLLYGSLFLISGALLLTITYVLVDRNRDDTVVVTLPNGATVAVSASETGPTDGEVGEITEQVSGVAPEDVDLSPEEATALASQQHAAQMRGLLTQSGIALGIMAVISVVLGWIVAGRVLRPLRTINAATRDISATNLHERLALDGPEDELKELGDTIDGLLDRLDAAFRSQRQFVANASHELRTPLARQRTLIQMALSDPDASVGSLRATLERVLATGGHEEQLIEALLTLTRGQSGLERRVDFDLATVAEEVLLARERDAQERGVQVRSALSPTPTRGDRRLAERLIANLVDNALRYNVPGGLVEVGAATVDGHAILSVANTGPFVPESDVGRLLRPFQRLAGERTNHGDGLGLGLSIVQAIANAHDAKLAIRPQDSGGLRVEVGFPANGAGASIAASNGYRPG